MIKLIIETVALLALCFVSDARAIEITHMEVDTAHLTETSQLNYAVSSPALAHNNWKTVSINGDNAVIYSSTCQQTLKSTQNLSDAEKALIVNVRGQLQATDSAVNINNQLTNRQLRRSSTKFSLDGAIIQANSHGGLNAPAMSIFNSDGISICKTDENNFSLSKAGLPNNLARIFLNNDIVTFIYYDKQVQMKPVTCLQSSEQQLLQQARLDVQQAEVSFKQRMDNFEQRMRQNMQSMNDNLSNMYAPNRYIPSYNAAQPNTYPNQQLQQQPQYPNSFLPFNGPFWGGMSNPLSYSSYQGAPQIFGNNFPFGPNNSPFTAGFPFNG